MDEEVDEFKEHTAKRPCIHLNMDTLEHMNTAEIYERRTSATHEQELHDLITENAVVKFEDGGNIRIVRICTTLHRCSRGVRQCYDLMCIADNGITITDIGALTASGENAAVYGRPKKKLENNMWSKPVK